MKGSPYSLIEARKICSEYQYLVGQPYTKDSDSVINCIAVTPFDIVNKERFIIYYLLFKDADIALSYDFKGLLFDVLVFAGSIDKQQLVHEDIDSWLTRNKLQHNYAADLKNMQML